MIKRIVLTFIALVLVAGALAGIKALQIRKMIEAGAAFAPPPETVTTVQAKTESWDSTLPSVGSVEAVQGVIVAAVLAGKVTEIAFESGNQVKAGALLVRQDTSSEAAQLRAAEASLGLAEVSLDRAKKLLAEKSIAQSEFDAAEAAYNQAAARVDEIRSVIEKKTVRAPFSGRLGIRSVNLGQTLREGDPIVSLQSLDTVFVNFFLPQENLPQVRTGQTVRVTTNALGGAGAEGQITAIHPELDPATRNIRLQATLKNPEERLRPGMFANVTVVLSYAGEKVLAIPATAVLYAPYGDTVFVVEENGAKDGQTPGPVLRQQFVQLGRTRGDFVAVLSGLKEGETVVTTGVFKLRNGQAVVVDNTLSPDFKLDPQPADD